MGIQSNVFSSPVSGDQASGRAALGIDSRRAIADAAATVSLSDFLLAYTSITVSRVVTLPAASTVPAGRRILIVDESGSVNSSVTISLAPNGTDTIDGSNTTQVAINIPRGRVELECNGSNGWAVLAWSVYYTNTLGADVPMDNTSNYFDGPSVAQGTVGRWEVLGATSTVTDTAGGANFFFKLWDGTTVLSSGGVFTPSASVNGLIVSPGGIISAPAGNIRLSCRDISSINGKMQFNQTGTSKDSTITVRRVP